MSSVCSCCNVNSSRSRKSSKLFQNIMIPSLLRDPFSHNRRHPITDPESFLPNLRRNQAINFENILHVVVLQRLVENNHINGDIVDTRNSQSAHLLAVHGERHLLPVAIVVLLVVATFVLVNVVHVSVVVFVESHKQYYLEFHLVSYCLD